MQIIAQRKEEGKSMKYEKPILEVIELELDDTVRTSPGGGLGDGDPDNDNPWG